MIELYFWTTPNGYKPLLFLEEAGIDYEIRPVNISKGEQFAPEFLFVLCRWQTNQWSGPSFRHPMGQKQTSRGLAIYVRYRG